MTITEDSVVVGVDPYDMPYEAFRDAQAARGSPATENAHGGYEAVAAHRVSIAFALAVFHHESQFATDPNAIVVKFDTKNPGNCRSLRTGWAGAGTVINTPRGPFVKYINWTEGWRDLAFRLVDPSYVYVQEGRRTIRQIVERFAPAEDQNNPDSYTAAVVKNMNRWIGAAPVPPPTPYPFMRGLVDIRAQLPTSGASNHGPQDRRAMSDKRGLVVHYSGPPNPKRDDPRYMMNMEARYHVDKNWCAAGQPPCYGDGYMYHIVIDDAGTKYLCRDLESVLWHCGAWPQNAIALSVHLLIGGDQQATPAALQSLRDVVDDWRKETGTPLTEVWGHQELQGTSCPGTLMAEFVLPYRKVAKPVSDTLFFNETQHALGGAFREYWDSHGGLMQYGFPLTDEVEEDGRTVQYFERAVFEWHPDNQDPFKVLLRRLGATAAASAGYSGPGIG